MFFFFKQKTAYEMRISDWSSDVCSSDLAEDRIEPDGTIDAGHDEHSFEHRLHRLQPATHRFGIAPDRQLTGEGFELFLRRRHSLPSMLRFQAGASRVPIQRARPERPASARGAVRRAGSAAGRRCVRADRKSAVEGKSGAVRVDLGGRRSIKKKQTTSIYGTKVK